MLDFSILRLMFFIVCFCCWMVCCVVLLFDGWIMNCLV